MNETLWNSTEEAVGQLALAAVTFFIHAYAIFLCFAIYDYQDEKPKKEGGPMDEQIKDLMQSSFWFLYYRFLVQFISIFTPPLNSDIAYLFSHIGYVMINFQLVSFFVLLYTQYLYFFYPDNVEHIKVSTMRWLSFLCKILLTIFCISLSMAFPTGDVPMMFQLLTKGKQYDR